MSTITLSQSFYLQSCCNCGVAFAVPDEFDEKRRKDKRSFYCPNGHSQSYIEGEVDRMLKQLIAAQQETERERQSARRAWDDLAKANKAAQRLKKRLSAGVCPCCNRTFEDLARHMTTKHKGYALPPAKDVKQITGAIQ